MKFQRIKITRYHSDLADIDYYVVSSVIHVLGGFRDRAYTNYEDARNEAIERAETLEHNGFVVDIDIAPDTDAR